MSDTHCGVRPIGSEHVHCQHQKGHAGEHVWQSRDLAVTWRWVAATKQRPLYVHEIAPTPMTPPPPLLPIESKRQQRRAERNRRRLEARFSHVGGIDVSS